MTRKETARILALITAVYPNIQLAAATLDAWQDLLGDLDYPVARAATARVLAQQTGSWLPAVGAIRQAAADLQGQHAPDPDAAWGALMAAVRRYGYMQEAAALQSLPPLVAQVARHIGWGAICESDLDVLRGQWGRLYGAAQRTHQEQVTVPAGLQRGALAPPSADTPAPRVVALTDWTKGIDPR